MNILDWFRKYRVSRLAPPQLTREQFYDALRSSRTDVVLAALEQHLQTNGSIDERAAWINKAEGPKGYWYMLGYCKAHKDLSGFLKRVRRPEAHEQVVGQEQPVTRTGGRARYVEG